MCCCYALVICLWHVALGRKNNNADLTEKFWLLTEKFSGHNRFMSARLGLFGQHKLNQQNQQRNCNNNNKAHPTVLHLSYPLRVMPISTTTTTTTTTKITDPTVFFLFGQNDKIYNAKHRKKRNSRLKQRRRKKLNKICFIELVK